MTSLHRLIAIIIVWLAFMWVSFFSNNPLIPASAVPILNIIYVSGALLATVIIVGIGRSTDSR